MHPPSLPEEPGPSPGELSLDLSLGVPVLPPYRTEDHGIAFRDVFEIVITLGPC